MPGTSIIYGTYCNENIEAAAADLALMPGTVTHVRYRDERLVLLFSGGDDYPCWTMENEDMVLHLEGMVYDPSETVVRDTMTTVAGLLNAGGDISPDLQQLIGESDGAFLGVIYGKRSSKLVVFNDRYARLSAFYYHSDGVFVLSREQKCILHQLPRIELDRHAISRFLFLEHQVGARTLFADVNRIMPSTQLALSTDSGGGIILNRHSTPPDYGDDNIPPPGTDTIKHLADLFLRSLEYRYSVVTARGYKCIADVSGGFDTRAVLMGLERIGADVTYLTHDLATGDESRVAAALGRVYGREVGSVRASHEWDIDEMARIVYMTDCSLNGWTSLVCWRDQDAKRRIAGEHTISFMGLGGHLIRHPHRAPHGHRDIAGVVRANLLQRYLDPDWAAMLGGFDTGTFVDQLVSDIDAYQEQSVEAMFKHLYYEYGYLTEAGEDRTRRFTWTVQPFHGAAFCSYALRHVSMKDANYSLFTRFLREIGGPGLSIPIHNSAIKLESPINVRYHDLMDDIRLRGRNIAKSRRGLSALYRRARRRDWGTDHFNTVADAILQAYDDMPELDRVIPRPSAELFLRDGYNMENVHRILSVLLYVRRLRERFGDRVRLA